MNFDFGMVESIVGKGENAGYQHFLLFPQCFEESSLSRSLKVMIVCKRVNESKICNNSIYIPYMTETNKSPILSTLNKIQNSIDNKIINRTMKTVFKIAFGKRLYKLQVLLYH